ncbi:GTP pyrophosphokinase (modular protein) [Vibrio nigripulchritudo MADA3029]|uniref:RelA/SpoT domain-containing protein n=1 Tax=Vibrio nigripulchritudo TaxID=28173 RepID=UPI0003B22A50|nr:RelA/SpoT domain-containing protein [Vibrio nigripulchritudo]CCN48922.1 GTP pyrophosphokinase (modular protein) [Vibrio nigripulchritudo MADA3020]CCN53208.1 GTP pyrophosphokinase (modular protein) [Vibrio nigripulchritudo MADA3021]CCN56810.1 GTP pyrophosphokinase (modular protein) [Vibrio nigripulchritudo MADA3029]
MANEQYKDQKRPLRFSKKDIDKSARDIRHGALGRKRDEAISKIQSFREFHLYPLMLMKNHLARTAARVSDSIIVARRLKRLPTIINKLERPTLDGSSSNAIKLTRMQDIAGCRAIVRNKKELLALQEKLQKSRSVHKIIRIKDYLASPKSSGYGGLHLIYSCYEGQKEKHDWKGAKVEIQLRTKLQHAWATSLEIIDTLETSDLKTSVSGHEKWRKFFYLFGLLVAHAEGMSKLDPIRFFDVITEATKLEGELNVQRKLNEYSIAINYTSDFNLPASEKDGKGLFLLIVKPSEKKDGVNLTVSYYPRKSAPIAIKELNDAELKEDISMSVLVSAEGTKTLRKAYPNYFGLASGFTQFIKKMRKEHEELLCEKASAMIREIETMKANGTATPEDLESMHKIKEGLHILQTPEE